MSPRWDTTIPLRALISAINFNLEWSNSGDKIRENRIRRNNKNQDRTKITLEEELNSGISKRSRDGYQNGGQQILKWTQYHRVDPICILQCNYNSFKLPVRIKSNLCRNLALIPRKPCHAPLPKIRGNGVATRVGDVYMRGKCPTYIRLSLIHIWRCRRSTLCRSRWSPYH